MARWVQMSAVMASIAWMAACEQQTEVQRQTHDLQEAQKDVGKVTHQLETDLAKARADVATLEQKLAMARQGLTDDVLENQKELQDALQAQEHNVNNEIGQAQREAEIHRRDTEAALQTLGQQGAPVPDPANTVEPAPGAAPGDAVERDQVVPVKGGPDMPTDAPPASSDIRNAPDTTLPAPSTAPAPTTPAPDPNAAPAPNANSANGSSTGTTTPPSTATPPAPPQPAPPAPEAPPADTNAPH